MRSMRSRLQRRPEGQPPGSRRRGLARTFSLLPRPDARLACAQSRCSSFPAPTGPPGASVYREQAISRVDHSRRALCWLYAVTADVNSRMISAATPLNLPVARRLHGPGHVAILTAMLFERGTVARRG